MFVASGAYLAAVFLIGDARRAGDEELQRYFARRALAAAAVAGIAAAFGLVELHAEARYIFDRLTDRGPAAGDPLRPLRDRRPRHPALAPPAAPPRAVPASCARSPPAP